jgi:hypothetical protein
MTPIPTLSEIDVAFGSVKHMPKYEDIPESFRRYHGDVHVDAIESWFYHGGTIEAPDTLKLKSGSFKARTGVDFSGALRAIKAILGSFEPKHEHKIAGCAFLLSEWFEARP